MEGRAAEADPHVEPPDGVAFFGPLISRLPSERDAVELWEHVVGSPSSPAPQNSSGASANARSCLGSG